MNNLEWTTVYKRLGDLVQYEYNPRILTDRQKAQLRRSLEKFSLAELPAINRDGTIVSGNQRCKVLTEIHGPDKEIEVRLPSRMLTPKEVEEYCIRANQNTGEWDFQLLNQFFETPDLLEWGFTETALPWMGADAVSDSLDTEDDDDRPIGLSNEYKIIVDCESEATQEELYHRLVDQGYTCRTVRN